jgi:hypothetical protein
MQDTLHQRSTELQAAQAQLVTAREERAASEAEQQRLQGQLQDAQRANLVLQQQMSQVSLNPCCDEQNASLPAKIKQTGSDSMRECFGELHHGKVAVG